MTPDLVVAGAWGVLVASPIVGWSRRRTVAGRLGGSGRLVRAAERPRREWGPVGRVLRGVWRRRSSARAEARLASALPAGFDLLVAAVGAGCAPQGAVELVARWGPVPIAEACERVLVATELGSSLPDALAVLRASTPQLAPMADVLVATAELGAPAGGALLRLADEARAAVRRRAETRARVLPVKLLFPLVFLVLPAFGLLTVAPALLSAFARL